MAINATTVSNLQTIEQLRGQFNNLVTDVSALESGNINFSSIAATTASIGNLSVTGSLTLTAITPTTVDIQGDRITFEGNNDDAFETTLLVTEPTADRTITLPNNTGTVALTSDLGFTNSTLFIHPIAEGDADLAGGETPFDADATDAFGIAVDSNLYDMNEPKGLTSTFDIGSNTGI
tara:strand:- start:1025 stop:1558 length:534 start_codon:yes stop_codon:yes gene_type:complete